MTETQHDYMMQDITEWKEKSQNCPCLIFDEEKCQATGYHCTYSECPAVYWIRINNL